MSIRNKVEKLIRHEKSARTLGSTAEADAFAGKIRQLLLDHRLPQPELSGPAHFEIKESGNSHSVHAADAGLAARKSRQEWSERLAFASASAFGCELLLKTGSNTVVFRGGKSDRVAAAALYAELAGKATESCNAEFSLWKRTPAGLAGNPLLPAARSVYSRRWKQSFLLGFSTAVCQRFVCGQHCHSQCQHTGALVRIGVAAKETPAGRPIGGIQPLYDAMYRGQAKAIAVLAELGRRTAA